MASFADLRITTPKRLFYGRQELEASHNQYVHLKSGAYSMPEVIIA
jgi:hypothetical protein